MDNLFLNLLDISITASWIVLAVLLLRIALKKAPKWVVCLLWAIVGLRLIMPFSMESVFSLLPERETVDAGSYQVQTGVDIIDDAFNEYFGDFSYVLPEGSEADAQDNIAADTPAVNVQTPEKTVEPVSVITGIWIAGMVLIIVYSVISWLVLRRKVREGVPYEDNIYVCDHVDSAFILGIFRPRIYLFSDLPEAQMGYVIGHEKAHLRRYDHLWKPLGFVLLTVHWFNPIMWLAYILLCRDIELACDEKAIQNMNLEDKKGYSEALMACSVQRRMVAACPVAFGEVAVKDRIKSVANYKKPTFWVIVIAIVACIMTAVCFLTDPVVNDEDYSYSNLERKYQKLQAQLASEKPIAAKDRYLAYEELFRMISEGAGKEMKQLAELARALMNDSVEFEDEEVFTVAERYANVYAELGAGNAGIQSLDINKSGISLDITMEHLGQLQYKVMMIDMGEHWYSNPNIDQPYAGELGDYMVEITFYNCGTSKDFNKKYPSGIHSLGTVAPGSYEIMMKHVVISDHCHKFYIGCDLPLATDEKPIAMKDQLVGSVSVRLNARGIIGTYQNVESIMTPGFNLSKFNISYYNANTNRRLTEEEARERYAVDNADIKRSVEAYIYEKYPNFDQLSAQDQAHLQKNFSDENIVDCRLFSPEDGKLMIIADIYTLDTVNITQQMVELLA